MSCCSIVLIAFMCVFFFLSSASIGMFLFSIVLCLSIAERWWWWLSFPFEVNLKIHMYKERKKNLHVFFLNSINKKTILEKKKTIRRRRRRRRAKEQFHNGKHRNVYTNQTDFKDSNVVIGVMQHSSRPINSIEFKWNL